MLRRCNVFAHSAHLIRRQSTGCEAPGPFLISLNQSYIDPADLLNAPHHLLLETAEPDGYLHPSFPPLGGFVGPIPPFHTAGATGPIPVPPTINSKAYVSF